MLRMSVACVVRGNGCSNAVTGPVLGLTGRGRPWATIADARIAKTNAGKSLLWCLLISDSEMLMAAARTLIGSAVDACLAKWPNRRCTSASAPRSLEHRRERRSRNQPA
jgi:hypothetical protein